MSEALADCLDVMMRGEDVSACLNKYPQHREHLQQLLDLILKIRIVSKDTTASASFVEWLEDLLTDNPFRERES